MSLQYENGRLIVWIDGACLGNHRHDLRSAGYGVWFNYNHPWNEYGALTDVHYTNQNAEIQAAIRAIKICAFHGEKILEIRTDSKFLIQSVTEFMPNWRQNGWCKKNGSPLKNITKFQELNRALIDNGMNTLDTFMATGVTKETKKLINWHDKERFYNSIIEQVGHPHADVTNKETIPSTVYVDCVPSTTVVCESFNTWKIQLGCRTCSNMFRF